jgi:hypothetical protein
MQRDSDQIEFVHYTKLAAAIRAWIVAKQAQARAARITHRSKVPTVAEWNAFAAERSETLRPQAELEWEAQKRLLAAHAAVSERVRQRILSGAVRAKETDPEA